MKVQKYVICQMVRHTDEYYAQTPQEEAASQKRINDFFLSWSPRVQQILGVHAMNMTSDWDWFGIFTCNELSDWEAFREEYRRLFPGRTEKSLSLPGVSHQEFMRATAGIEHYRKLRELGAYPGQAEVGFEQA
jgi:hypothetical protein